MCFHLPGCSLTSLMLADVPSQTSLCPEAPSQAVICAAGVVSSGAFPRHSGRCHAGSLPPLLAAGSGAAGGESGELHAPVHAPGEAAGLWLPCCLLSSVHDCTGAAAGCAPARSAPDCAVLRGAQGPRHPRNSLGDAFSVFSLSC